MSRPLIGLSADLEGDHYTLRGTYVRAIVAAGGLPVILPHEAGLALEWTRRCDGIVLTGGDDPIMERFGVPTDPRAKPVAAARQASELAVLDDLRTRPEVPLFGICLGMQLMALHAGGTFEQHLPDRLATADRHRFDAVHEVSGALGRGSVTSHHRQAVTHPGALQVVATAFDGVIEAVTDPDRAFCLGVQWHPERTADPALGADLFVRFVAAAQARAAARAASRQ